MFEKTIGKIKNFIKSSDVFSNISVFSSSKYKRNYSQADFLNYYAISLYANKAVNKRAEKVGEIEFQLTKGDKVVEEHEILDLLNKPNQAFSGNQFWALYQKYMDIFGEVYILKDTELRMGGVTRVNELHLLRSDLVKPKFNEKTGELTSIDYNTSKGTTTYQGDEIIYAHNPDPASPLRGESLIKAGIRQIETSVQIDEYHSKVLENGGRVEGIFTFDTDNLTKEQLKDLKEKFQAEHGEASKTGLPMFLAGGAKFERLGLNPAELAYLETKGVTLNDILILTGVPRAMLGVTSDETFSNADASIRIFLRETIKPLLDGLTTTLDDEIKDQGLELTFIDPTPENREEKRKDLESGIKNYYIMPNEAREEIGKDPAPGGDKLYIPFNLVPLGESPAVEDSKAKSFAHPLKSRDNRVLYHALCVKRLDRRQMLMLDVIRDYFKGQRLRLITQLEVKKQFKKKALLGEIFNTTIEIKLAKEAVLPALQALLKDSAEDSKQIAGSDWDFTETADVKSWLDKKTEIFAEQITTTTFKELQKEFQESLDEGENRKQLVDRINETYGNISKSRAETIARTETHGVTQYGTLEGYKQASLPIKIWVWAPGTKGGVRDEHLAMDGEEQPIGTSFSNGLDFPGDPSGGADETINCQCFI